ncbi:MAG: hypothetical protein M3Q38_05160 [Chloroflexota bacterium]|nr:hypothetical protein [Chloroflexota bacterium]
MLDDVERARPWLHPLVVVTDGAPDRQAPPNDEPIVEQSSTAAAFAALVSSAEREELRLGHLDTAVGLYAKAATEAATPIRRLEALNGLARTEFKAGRFGRSIAAYNALLASADSLDPAQARWAVLAPDRLLQCDSETGDQGALARHALDLYRFLIRYRYLLDRDAVDFYRRRVTETIGQTRLDDSPREAWQRLRDREEMFVSLDDTIREVTLDKQPSASAALPPVALIPIGRLGPKNGGPSVSVAYSLESSNLRVLLDRTLREPVPWSEILNPLELGAMPDGVVALARSGAYRDDFRQAFGADPVIDDVARALATYVRTIVETPTLREVARTAPYMHDGSIKTLGAVIDYYDRVRPAEPGPRPQDSAVGPGRRRQGGSPCVPGVAHRSYRRRAIAGGLRLDGGRWSPFQTEIRQKPGTLHTARRP